MVDDSKRPWICASLAIFFLCSVPVWWATTNSVGAYQARAVIPDAPSDIQFPIRIQLVSAEADLSPFAGSLLEEALVSGEGALRFDIEPSTVAAAAPSFGQYRLLVDSLHGCTSELSAARVRRVCLGDVPAVLEELKASIQRPYEDPVFGLDMALEIRVTLLAIGNATIDHQAFHADFASSFRPLLQSLDTLLPVRTTFQVPSLPPVILPPLTRLRPA